MVSLSKFYIGLKTIIILVSFHVSILFLLLIRSRSLLDFDPSTLAFWSFVLISLLLYLKVSLMDPGYWPTAQTPSPKPNGTFVVLVEDQPHVDQENIPTIKDENLPSENLHDLSRSSLVNLSRSETNEEKPRRFCTFCKLEQPYRTKHCRDCRKCVALYDHHCPWIGGCVGQNNRIYFFWYIFFQCIELWFAGVIVKAMQCIRSFENNGGALLWIYENAIRVFVMFTICVFGLMVSILLSFHCCLAARNFTTWEFLSWSKIEYLKNRPKKVSPFSKGLVKNLKEYCIEKFPPFKNWEIVA